MNIIEPFASLKIESNNEEDGQFLSFWRFSCLSGCLVCEKPKPFDLTSSEQPIDECFGSEWYLVSRAEDLRALSDDVNQKFNYIFSSRVNDALRKNRDYVDSFHQDLNDFDEFTLVKADVNIQRQTKLLDLLDSITKVLFF